MTYHIEALMASNDRLMDDQWDVILWGVFADETSAPLAAFPTEAEAERYIREASR